MASDFLQQYLPAHLSIVVILLYHGKESWQIPLRFARHLTGMEDPEQLLAYLPKVGGFLLATLAQEWIEEGKTSGFDLGKQEDIDIGKKEGVAEGVAAQRQTLLRLVRWRFALTAEAAQPYAQQFAQIQNLDHLLHLVDQLLILQERTEFDAALRACLPPDGEG